MIFSSKDKLFPIKPSTQVILDGTFHATSNQTDENDTWQQFLLELDAAIKAYEAASFFHKRWDTSTDISELNTCIYSLRDADHFSAAEKKNSLSHYLHEFIASLESMAPRSYLLYQFEQHGIYKRLYEKPRTQGIIDTDLQELVNVGYERVALSIGFIALFSVLGAIGMPFMIGAILNGAFVGAYMYLSDLIGGLYTQRQAAKRSLPSLILGYERGHFSVMKSNDALTQAIAWGMINSTERAYLLSVLFFFTGMILSFFSPLNMWVLPIISLLTPLANQVASWFVEKSNNKDISQWTNTYQQSGIKRMALTEDEISAWRMNIKRKRYTYRASVLTMFIGLAGFVCSNVFSAHLPVVFGTLLLNTVLPFTVIVPITALLLVSGVYLYQKKNEQTNNRFKLSFEPKETISLIELKERKPLHLYQSRFEKTDEVRDAMVPKPPLINGEFDAYDEAEDSKPLSFR